MSNNIQLNSNIESRSSNIIIIDNNCFDKKESDDQNLKEINNDKIQKEENENIIKIKTREIDTLTGIIFFLN
jgi:hypothetical protein